MLEIAADLLPAMHAHCASEYPHECCGALIGRSQGEWNIVSRLQPLRNAEPDAPERRFTVDSGDLNALDRALRAENAGLNVIGFYHSHPDSPARPSSTDLEWAWERYSYIIVSVKQGQIADTRSYRLEPDESKFEEEPIQAD